MNEEQKKARRAYYKKYYAANREHLLAQFRARYQANRERHLERTRKWRINNPEKERAKVHRYYVKHRGKKLAATDRWRREHLGEIQNRCKKRNQATIQVSHRHGQFWTQHELLLLTDRVDLTCFEISRMIGRSWYAVRQMRQQIKRGLVKERFDFNNPGEGI